MKLIYVASPYAGDIQENTAFAKKACRHVLHEGHAFFAPHLLYPTVLNDQNPEERQAGLDMGLLILPRCDELWCYGDRISPGMFYEIEAARQNGIPVRRVTEQNNGFVVGNIQNKTMAEAPSSRMTMGMG